MLTVTKLSKHFGSRSVFRNVNFEVPFGAVAAVTGSNGAGKSTLLRILAGLTRAASGEVQWQQENIRCGLFAPDAPVYREMTVKENIDFFASALPGNHNLDQHIERFELTPRTHDFAGDLSSGWRARLQLAVAALGEPHVLLLDEASAHLDGNGLALLHGLCDEQRTRGITLVATNDPREASRCDFQIIL
jgi:heme exporter protein A